jgi:hypothetical protein
LEAAHADGASDDRHREKKCKPDAWRDYVHRHRSCCCGSYSRALTVPIVARPEAQPPAHAHQISLQRFARLCRTFALVGFAVLNNPKQNNLFDRLHLLTFLLRLLSAICMPGSCHCSRLVVEQGSEQWLELHRRGASSARFALGRSKARRSQARFLLCELPYATVPHGCEGPRGTLSRCRFLPPCFVSVSA